MIFKTFRGRNRDSVMRAVRGVFGDNYYVVSVKETRGLFGRVLFYVTVGSLDRK